MSYSKNRLKKIEKGGGAKRSKDPLSPLGVIKRLEVGPVRIEKKRLTAPYKITQK